MPRPRSNPSLGARATGWLALFATPLLFAASPASAATPDQAPDELAEAPADAEPSEDPRIDSADQLLDALEARGKTIQSYKAEVVYTREQRLLGDKQTRIGRVAYLAPEPADHQNNPATDEDPATNNDPAADQADHTETDHATKFAVFFNKLVVGHALRERSRYFIFDGRWLAEIDPQRKQFIRRQVVGPDESFNPLKLGEGPFPLPLGQEKQRVLRVFKAELIQDDDAPDRLHHLRLLPRADEAGGGDAAFDRVDIWYDPQTLLPRKVVTIEGADEAEANVTTVKLTDAELNTMGRDKAQGLFDTTPPKRGSGWHVEVKPLDAK